MTEIPNAIRSYYSLLSPGMYMIQGMRRTCKVDTPSYWMKVEEHRHVIRFVGDDNQVDVVGYQ